MMNTTKSTMTINKRRSFWRILSDAIIEFILWISRVRIRTENMEAIPQDGKFLLVANHVSMFDPIVVLKLMKKYHMLFVSKPENFRIPIGGFLMKKCGFISIDRENARNAIQSIYAAAEIIREDGCPMGVYPEGTRNKEPEKGLLPFHNGVFKIAKRAEAPIVVAVTENTDHVSKNWPWKRTEVVFSVIDVINRENASSQNDRMLGERIRADMEEKLYGQAI